MRYYPSKVVGVRYEGRDRYIRRNVQIGDSLQFLPEPDNPHSSDAVAIYHAKTKIGYVPSEKRWIKDSIAEGDTHEVEVTELIENDDGQLVALAITVGVLDAPLESSALPLHLMTLESLRSELLVLISIAKLDSRLVKAERELILRYAQERALDKNLAFDADVAAHIDKWVKRQDPTLAEAILHVEQLASTDPSALGALFQVTEIVAGIDGKTQEDELRRVSELQDMIRYLHSKQ